MSFKKPSRPETLLILVVLVLVAIPIINMADLLVRYSVNVPWWDQVSFVDLMTKLHKGTLSIYDLWTQHNEHRILVPQAFELVVGKLTGFNFRAPVLLNLVTALGSFGLLLSLLKQTFTSNKLLAGLAVVFAWFMFSPIQAVNWIWGFQLAFFMTVFFAILTIWLLVHDKLLRSEKLFMAVLVTASITTYCNGNGLLVWPIGLAILLWRRVDRSKLLQWLGVGVVMCGSYLYKFHRSPGSPQLSTLIRHPLAVIKYVLGYLGRTLSTAPTNGRYVAAVLIVVFALGVAVVYKKRQLDKIIGWLALAGFAVFTGVLAAISRLNYGVDHGFNSTSYPTLSLLFVLAALVVIVYSGCLLAKDFKRQRLGAYLAGCFALGVLAALPLPAIVNNFTTGQTNLKALGLHLRGVQSCVYTVTSPTDPCLLKLFPGQAQAWGYVQDLKALRWGDFKNGP
jgi:hypothetical protein